MTFYSWAELCKVDLVLGAAVIVGWGIIVYIGARSWCNAHQTRRDSDG